MTPATSTSTAVRSSSIGAVVAGLEQMRRYLAVLDLASLEPGSARLRTTRSATWLATTNPNSALSG